MSVLIVFRRLRFRFRKLRLESLKGKGWGLFSRCCLTCGIGMMFEHIFGGYSSVTQTAVTRLLL